MGFSPVHLRNAAKKERRGISHFYVRLLAIFAVARLLSFVVSFPPFWNMFKIIAYCGIQYSVTMEAHVNMTPHKQKTENPIQDNIFEPSSSHYFVSFFPLSFQGRVMYAVSELTAHQTQNVNREAGDGMDSVYVAMVFL